MANKRLFDTRAASIPAADTTNLAGGRAYKRSNEAALAQYALTGVFGNTFYADAKFQLDAVLKLLKGADPRYVAQLAIYSRRDGYMKDMPSFLVAWLAAEGAPQFETAFRAVIDNGKMLRNFVQYIRSGVLGRKSFGSRIKREIQRWFAQRDEYGLVRAVPGNAPSLADIVKMVHPPAGTRAAFYAWLLGNDVSKRKTGYFVRTRSGWRKLPDLVNEFEAFKAKIGNATSRSKLVAPDVPFQMLTGLALPDRFWKDIARNAKWMMTRMNLNTFLRHGVFQDKELVDLVAARLRDPNEVRRARQFPYQLMAAYMNVNDGVPSVITEALQDAMEVALENVPEFGRPVNVIVDVSGSMGSSITGWNRGGRESKVRCVDVAGLFAAAILRKNTHALILPVDTQVRQARFNPRDSVMTITKGIARFCGGGTNLSAAMNHLNCHKATGDIVIVSDNESWADRYGYRSGTGIENEFESYRRRDKQARMVLIDIVASDNTQVKTRKNVLNVGGFGDQVFKVANEFFKGNLEGDHLVNQIKSTVEV